MHGIMLVGYMIAVERRRVVMCREVSAGILFSRLTPGPPLYTGPVVKGVSIYIKVRQKFQITSALKPRERKKAATSS
jgi:hypothetical protein